VSDSEEHLVERQNTLHKTVPCKHPREFGGTEHPYDVVPATKENFLPHTNFERVVAWHILFDVPSPVKPGFPSVERQVLREDLIQEESNELSVAIANRDLVGVADALADLLYVVYGTAAEFGLPIDDIFEEVHRSNMSKAGPDGPIYREDGKVLKGPNYSPPVLEKFLEER